jgi:mono/diheme cytochrome c family protein
MKPQFNFPATFRLVLITLGLIVLVSVQAKDAPQSPSKEGVNILLQIEQEHDIKALKLMAQQCFSCHNPDMTGGPQSRLGPPMFMVRRHYYHEGVSKDEFIAGIVSFVKNPSEEKSKMKGAIKNFGLMPGIYVDEDEIKLIAAYIYDNDLSSEQWKKKWEAFKKG